MKSTLFTLSIAVSFFAAQSACAVSVAYNDPAGGWTYAYLGEGVAPGTTVGNDFTALDGTWDRQNGSDEWDGSGLGGTFDATNRPGGVGALSDAGTTFIRVQDPGNPTQHSFPDPSSNRKLYLGHDIATDAGVMDPSTILNGVTLTFRARIATPATGIVDPQYPDTGGNSENSTVAAGTAWPTAGNGLLGHDGGKGNFGIRQSTGDQIISFSLCLNSERRSDGMLFGQTGLNMNSLNGTAPSGTVDPYQNEGTLNVLPISDPTNFHEFWITIQADQSGGGTHKVDVYLDGAEVSNTFHVTAGNGNDYDLSYIAMGAGATPQQAALDVDFFAYKQGIHLPGGPLVPGDTDGDDIGGEFPDDFEPIRANFRNMGNRSMGDLTGDGTIDFADFREWKAVHLGGGGSLEGLDLSFGSNVPEPGSAALLILSALALVVRRGVGSSRAQHLLIVLGQWVASST